MVKYFVLLLLSFHAYSIVPLEDIVITGASEFKKNDPLDYVFFTHYQKESKDKKFIEKMKLFSAMMKDSDELNLSCENIRPVIYSSLWSEQQAKRSIVSTLQWIGLELSMSAIGNLAKDNNISESEFEILSNNLANNYCSKNLSLISLKKIKKILLGHFKNPKVNLVQNLETSPFVTQYMKNILAKDEMKKNELGYAIKNFRAFCSWGGDIEDYRLLSPYLKNSFIMSHVFNHILGKVNQYDEKLEKVVKTKNSQTYQVVCEELICRKVNKEQFDEKFVLSIGSTGLEMDLKKLYCHHFQFQDYSNKTIPQVQAWIKKNEVEDPVFEALFFISLLSQLPDPIFGLEKYLDIPFLVKSSMDELWQNWSKKVLSLFSKDLFYEESLKLKLEKRISDLGDRVRDFHLKANLMLGDFDRVVEESDKFKVSFQFRIPENYLIQIVQRWQDAKNKIDLSAQESLKKDFSDYLSIQLRKKKEFFQEEVWNDDFSRVIAEELLLQALSMKGQLLSKYSQNILTIPLEIEYGIFAMSYLKDRAQVKLAKNLKK